MTPRLFAIAPASGAVPPDVVDEWVGLGGLRCGLALVLREPGATAARLLDPRGRLAPLRARARERGLVVVLGCAATDLEVAAAAVRAGYIDGVQLRGDPAADVLGRARDRLGAPALVGRSCHGAPQGGHAAVDYTAVAPIRPTVSHPGAPPLGIAGLRAWCVEPGARIVALGGLGPDDADTCVRAGAWGLAGISAFFGPDRGRATAAFVRAVAGA